MGTIIVGRVLQGFGGGGIDLLVQVILADMTTLEERSTYLGLMAIPSAVGNIMCPTVGALFSTYASWRWIGWVNLPWLGVGTPLVIIFLKLRPIRSILRSLEISSASTGLEWRSLSSESRFQLFQ
ncbi:hypothetical protein PENCOP_c009G03567 [Penicillium coprophilum]|uniref:Major facilitator superfamily (MFS) profile domain-containing protein n=1 Tax=Penicillium coprophilum TaxID=36646 RepID=A0A1V6UHQ2_9EURO|nr:hypothetical protein PENCOP_c009G03567 [Penicillium coprophilum]